jgi:HSP20 family protein
MARNLMSPLRSGSLFELGFEPFSTMQRGMNRLFDEIVRGSDVPLPTDQGNGGAATLLAPRMDVTETDEELRITAEMPGVAANDVEVRLDDNMLTIRGEKRFEAAPNGRMPISRNACTGSSSATCACPSP